MSYSQSLTATDVSALPTPSGKLPVIMQSEIAECGLACLAMIAASYGYESNLVRLRQQFPVSLHGASLKDLIEIAEQLQLSGRALKLEMPDLDKLQLPCIAHWDLNHFVVLKSVTRRHVIIHDPAIGVRKLSLAEAANHFTGVALELRPNKGFTKKKQTQTLGFSQFWSGINGLKRSLLTLLLISLMLQLFAIASPYYLQTVIDDVLLRSDLNLLTVLALGFGLLLVIEVCTHLLRDFTLLRLSSRMNFQMASNLFHHLIRLPMDYFIKRHMGDILSRFSSLHHIRELMINGVISVFIDGLMALITLTVMFWYNSTLAFLVILFVVLYGAVRITFFLPVKYMTEERLVADAHEQSHFMESVRTIQTLKMFEKESQRHNQWQNRYANTLNKHVRIRSWEFGFDGANRVLFGVENILVIYFAAISVTENVMTVGMLFAFMSFKNRFTGAMDNLIVKAIEFKMLDLHFERLADIIFAPTDPLLTKPGNSTAAANVTIRGDVQIEQMGFAYSATSPGLFSNLNLSINAGEIIAIVGASGTGKSTLMKCMMGLLTPTDGFVRLDGKPLRDLPGYRRYFAGVLQDDQLLSGSIAENIACFDSQVDMARVHQLAKTCCVYDDIMQLPMQFNTLVGELGGSLSGGQKQRILLARALYHEPKVLFLDEATSHLDEQNESNICQQLAQLSMTRIVIAHRIETIRHSHRVFQLANGELIDVTHQYNP